MPATTEDSPACPGILFFRHVSAETSVPGSATMAAIERGRSGDPGTSGSSSLSWRKHI